MHSNHPGDLTSLYKAFSYESISSASALQTSRGGSSLLSRNSNYSNFMTSRLQKRVSMFLKQMKSHDQQTGAMSTIKQKFLKDVTDIVHRPQPSADHSRNSVFFQKSFSGA